MFNALALVESPDHVCYRYRVQAFERALRAHDVGITAVPIARNGLARLCQFARLPRVDAIVIQRKLLAGTQLRLLRRATDRLVFDFDDAVFLRDSYNGRGHHSAKRARRFQATVNTVDAIIAGNDYLADAALKAGAPAEKVVVIPTCIETGRYPNDFGPFSQREGLELVWIGSSSTLRGLEARRDLFDRLVQEIPGIRLRVICDRFPSLGQLPIVEVPWNESTEAARLAEGDVGISWIPDDPWSRGKCGLKVLQYQAAGLPVVTNPVGVHPEMVRPGKNGRLAETIGEWVDALRGLAADPEQRRLMGRNARQSVDEGYSVSAWSETFVSTLTGRSADDQWRTGHRAEIRQDGPSVSSSRRRAASFFKGGRLFTVPPSLKFRRHENGVDE